MIGRMSRDILPTSIQEAFSDDIIVSECYLEHTFNRLLFGGYAEIKILILIYNDFLFL